MHFVQAQDEAALAEFNKADALLPGQEFTLVGLAISHHAIGQVKEAIGLWQQLIERDPNYKDADWVKEEHTWADQMVEEARKLIAKL